MESSPSLMSTRTVPSHLGSTTEGTHPMVPSRFSGLDPHATADAGPSCGGCRNDPFAVARQRAVAPGTFYSCSSRLEGRLEGWS